MKFKIKCNDGKERVVRPAHNTVIRSTMQIHGKQITGDLIICGSGYYFQPTSGHIGVWHDPKAHSKIEKRRKLGD